MGKSGRKIWGGEQKQALFLLGRSTFLSFICSGDRDDTAVYVHTFLCVSLKRTYFSLDSILLYLIAPNYCWRMLNSMGLNMLIKYAFPRGSLVVSITAYEDMGAGTRIQVAERLTFT